MAKAMKETESEATTATTPEQIAYPMKYDVRIYNAKETGTQRATATVNINDAFAIRNIKVLEGSKGLFVSMPSYKVGSEYKDICFPCTKEAREQFNAAVINSYEQELAQHQTKSQAQEQPPFPEQTQSMDAPVM